jgi:hypothetical protein
MFKCLTGKVEEGIKKVDLKTEAIASKLTALDDLTSKTEDLTAKVDILNAKTDVLLTLTPMPDSHILRIVQALQSFQELKELESKQSNEQEYKDASDAKNNGTNDEPKKTGNFIKDFFGDKEHLVKEEVREFMLEHFNIESIDDEVEGDIYDFIVETIWGLIFNRLF